MCFESRVPTISRIIGLLTHHQFVQSNRPVVVDTHAYMQTAEWDEPESDLDEDDILDLQALGNADENKGSWAGTLLKTGLGGFLHGLTGTKVSPREPREMFWSVVVVRGQKFGG